MSFDQPCLLRSLMRPAVSPLRLAGRISKGALGELRRRQQEVYVRCELARRQHGDLPWRSNYHQFPARCHHDAERIYSHA